MPRRALLGLLAWLVPFGPAAAGAPRVVATIPPLHSLAAGVMQGVGEPQLIIRGYGSPHSYQMRPSDAAALHEADVIFWIGESLETFLQNPLSTLGKRARIVQIMDSEGLIRYRNREGAAWARGGAPEHGRAPGATRDGHGHEHGQIDAHVWLDPVNARVMVGQVVKALSAADPVNASRYRANGVSVDHRLAQLEVELARTFAPVRTQPYLVFHDAYQYLERRYGLNAVGAITLSPDRPPSAKRLQELRAAVKRQGARCVFREPQFESALIASVIEHTGARQAVLDPLGAEFAAGPELYFQMMRGNAAAIARCLSSRTDSG